VRILGVDPGSVTTGYGVIDSDGRTSRYITHGCIRARRQEGLPTRLGRIQQDLAAVVIEHEPAEMAIEDVFLARNPMAALKLGQARGAAICAGVNGELTLAEYPARLVKQTVVGIGGAAKGQVQHMVGVLLNLNGEPIAEDAADALAIALCHAHARTQPAVQRGTSRRRRAVRWK
jgi:crossover junction endodeoxyribonuclease RuvC